MKNETNTQHTPAPELLKENEQLKALAESRRNLFVSLSVERDNLQAIIDQLLEALKEVNEVSSHHFGGRIQELVEKAIAKAEGKNLPVS